MNREEGRHCGGCFDNNCTGIVTQTAAPLTAEPDLPSDNLCGICGEKTNSCIGNLSMMSMQLPYEYGGKINSYHIGCVVDAVENAKQPAHTESPLLQSNWISVEDRLPENNEWTNDTVLFFSKKHGFIMVGCYDCELSDWTRLPWEKGYQSLKFEDVTHWMPLPEYPTRTT